MQAPWRHRAPWLLGWAALLLAGSLAIVRIDIAQRRSIFQDQARSAHRLFSQQAAQRGPNSACPRSIRNCCQ